MVYLIDDKKVRQKNLGWSSNILEKYKDILAPIYTNIDLQKVKHEIFNGDNIILFHESFFDVPENYHVNDGLQVRRDLNEYSNKNERLVVFFSGSIGSRSIESNSAHIPVEILYRNLATFCERYKANDQNLMKQIVFGSTDVREEILLVKSEIWESLYDLRDDQNMELNATLLQALEQIEKLVGKKILKEGISTGYLKYQLQNI